MHNVKPLIKLKRVVNEGLNTFGYEIKRQHSLERAVWLREMGIKTVLDVGANVGQFTTSIRKLLPEAKIYAFEPVEACFQDLARRRQGDALFQAFPYALGAEDGSAELNVNDFTPSSSLLPTASAHVEEFPFTARTAGATVEIRRLDSVVPALDLTEPMLIKLDVQGFEMQVINGGRETLARADVLITEISFAEFYEGQTSFEELYSEIQDLGLRFHGILEQVYSTRNDLPLFCDALFVRAGKL
jgi:FkbM family methyltransferase